MPIGDACPTNTELSPCYWHFEPRRHCHQKEAMWPMPFSYSFYGNSKKAIVEKSKGKPSCISEFKIVKDRAHCHRLYYCRGCVMMVYLILHCSHLGEFYLTLLPDEASLQDMLNFPPLPFRWRFIYVWSTFRWRYVCCTLSEYRASLTNFYRRNRAGHGTMARRRRRRRWQSGCTHRCQPAASRGTRRARQPRLRLVRFNGPGPPRKKFGAKFGCLLGRYLLVSWYNNF